MTSGMKHCHVRRRPGHYIQHTSFSKYGLTRVADKRIQLFIFSFVIFLVAVKTSWWYKLKKMWFLAPIMLLVLLILIFDQYFFCKKQKT